MESSSVLMLFDGGCLQEEAAPRGVYATYATGRRANQSQQPDDLQGISQNKAERRELCWMVSITDCAFLQTSLSI